jgi:hypothetical protein
MTIFQRAIALGQSFSSLLHIIVSAPLSLVDLWQMTTFWSSFCYRWLSFCSHESSLHRALIWVLLIVCFWFFFRLCLLVFSFALYFCYMGSHPLFWFMRFSSYCFGILLLFLLIYHLALLTSKDHHFVIELMQSFNKAFLVWFLLLLMFFEGNNLIPPFIGICQFEHQWPFIGASCFW